MRHHHHHADTILHHFHAWGGNDHIHDGTIQHHNYQPATHYLFHVPCDNVDCPFRIHDDDGVSSDLVDSWGVLSDPPR